MKKNEKINKSLIFTMQTSSLDSTLGPFESTTQLWHAVTSTNSSFPQHSMFRVDTCQFVRCDAPNGPIPRVDPWRKEHWNKCPGCQVCMDLRRLVSWKIRQLGQVHVCCGKLWPTGPWCKLILWGLFFAGQNKFPWLHHLVTIPGNSEPRKNVWSNDWVDTRTTALIDRWRRKPTLAMHSKGKALF